MRPVLVTGGAGFIGCNLADRLAQVGHDVLVFDALKRPGVADNLAWLRNRHPRRISTIVADIREEAEVARAVAESCAVFHFAAQVAVTTSLDDPRHDFEINAGGTLLLLECIRRYNPGAPLVFASTNKVYGHLPNVVLAEQGQCYLPVDQHLRDHGINEEQPLSFETPYGCSKGAADQYVLDYARGFGLLAAVLRMSCVYGPRQHGTEDQGWVAHFLRRAMAREPITIYGDGRQVRDILYIADAIEAYLAAWQRIQAVSGRAFNLGGGPRNAVSLLQIIRRIEGILGISAELTFAPWRLADQQYFVADSRCAAAALGLNPPIDWSTGIGLLARWLSQQSSPVMAKL
ncbi:MAG: NAD-dependent epimerase/dehydratase family protein [Acetobacteraceae bacterium]|nr:NAD-dependent epimerase/dehydratase family protein [Acetobacteraceae bacterium]